jgi:ParB family chromosome partitioning protein
VRETEQLVKRLQQPEPAKKPPPEPDPDIRNLQTELSEKLGAGVRIQHSSTGKGKLVIQYNTVDELEGILSHIR